MDLERKPVTGKDAPGYPNSEEYAADRRTFLLMVGTAAAGAVGFYALNKAQPVAGGPAPVPTAIQPQANVAGSVPAVQIQPPAVPQAKPLGEAVSPSMSPLPP